MTATELFEMLRQNNGQTIHVPQGLAIQFIEECKEKELRINCTMEFHDGVCKIVTPNVSGETLVPRKESDNV